MWRERPPPPALHPLRAASSLRKQCTEPAVLKDWLLSFGLIQPGDTAGAEEQTPTLLCLSGPRPLQDALPPSSRGHQRAERPRGPLYGSYNLLGRGYRTGVPLCPLLKPTLPNALRHQSVPSLPLVALPSSPTQPLYSAPDSRSNFVMGFGGLVLGRSGSRWPSCHAPKGGLGLQSCACRGGLLLG